MKKVVLTFLIFVFLVFSSLIFVSKVAKSQTWPTSVTLKKIAGGFIRPLHLAEPPDASKRLFIVEQEGKIKIIKNGTVLTTPFLDISNKVSRGSEQGLLSIAFPTGFSLKKYFYISYTDVNGDSVIARVKVSQNIDIADPTSEERILFVDQSYSNHNGGLITFGPDGFLYIALGDGGSAGDSENRAQNINDLLGKILRIDVESGGEPYSIPSDNPFVGVNGRDEIWAVGFRNPWKFSFDKLTGDLFIADVGENKREEVNFSPFGTSKGVNYGWRCYEGTIDHNLSGCLARENYIFPIYDYPHGVDNVCSVTGGFVYRGSKYPSLDSIYIYGDFCSGQIWGLRTINGIWENKLLLDSGALISSFGQDLSGNLYVIDHASGDILEIQSGTVANVPGDANGDGKVDLIDYVAFYNNYGRTTQNGAQDADFNFDTKVDLIDYVVWWANYGRW